MKSSLLRSAGVTLFYLALGTLIGLSIITFNWFGTNVYGEETVITVNSPNSALSDEESFTQYEEDVPEIVIPTSPPFVPCPIC